MTPEQFLVLADVLPEPILLLSPDGYILAINRRMAGVVSRSPSAVINIHLSELVLDPPEKLESYLRSYARTGGMIPGSLTVRQGNGEDVTYRCEGTFIRPQDDETEPVILLRLQFRESASSRFIALNQRIEDLVRETRLRRQAELTAEEQRERWQVTLSSIGDAVIATDDRAQITFMNHVAEVLTGWNAQEAAGQPLVDIFRIINEESGQTAESPVDRVLREGRVVGLANHTLLVRRDGSTRPIDDSGAPIRDASGQMIGVVLVFRDVAERWQGEQALHFIAEVSATLMSSIDYEETLTNVVRSAVPRIADACGLDILQDDGTILRLASVHVDPVKEDLMRGLWRERPLAQNAEHPVARAIATKRSQLMTEVTDEDFNALVEDPEQRAILRMLAPRAYYAVPLLGRERVLGSLLFWMSDPERKFGSLELALADELAHRAAAAMDNAALYRQAQQAIAQRQEFLSVASHELKTPLTTIKGYTQLIHRGLLGGRLDNAIIADYFGELEGQVERYEHLVNRLLDISRLQQQGLELDLQEMDLVVLVNEVVARFEQSTERTAGHVLVVEAPASLVGIWDRDRLDQVLTNLISNALKYSPDGGEVRVSVQQHDEAVDLVVSDRGIGIASIDLEQLFRPFFRSKALRTDVAGTGLGLYITAQIAQRHGGSIHVESEEGTGSTFTVTLPVRPTTP